MSIESKVTQLKPATFDSTIEIDQFQDQDRDRDRNLLASSETFIHQSRALPNQEGRGVLYSEWEAWLKSQGQPKYRAAQIWDWLYKKKITKWNEASNLPKVLVAALESNFLLHHPEAIQVEGSKDTTRKFLWGLKDGAKIESVWIPANPAAFGAASHRTTLCVSTQVGCAYGCKFCASGLLGWKRDLSAAEIVDQIISVERWAASQDAGSDSNSNNASASVSDSAGKEDRKRIHNLVIMGMGEPLANYDALMRALRILNHGDGTQIGARRVTISTSGLAPQIERLAKEPEQFRLAISLHGATNETRSKIMPINRKYPLEKLIPALEKYCATRGRMITLEYILIAGVNDQIAEAPKLAKIANSLNAKINLIPYNKVDGMDWERPSVDSQEAFCSALRTSGARVTLRREKGHDINAACGQLRLREENTLTSNV
jgi:23S rRNA (adenine2503-C2)-methyltransferase